MFKLSKSTLMDRISNTNPQYLALGAALFLEFLLMSFGTYGFYFMDHYMIIPPMLFLGMAFGRPFSTNAWRQLVLPALMVCWFFITQTLHFSMDLAVRSSGTFFSVYLLAYLFAAFSQDGKKQWGLHLASLAYIGASLMLVLLTLLMDTGLLPGFLQQHIYWNGSRLQAMWHPNICATIFLVGIGFCLFQMVQLQKKWYRVLLAVIAVILFVAMALTNCRTAIIMCGCIVGGLLFLCIHNGSWKRFILGIVAALVTIVLLFNGAHMIYQANIDRLIGQYTREIIVEPEEAAPASATSPDSHSSSSSSGNSPLRIDSETGEFTLSSGAGQGSLSSDFGSMNGRTNIWKACVQAVRNNRSVMLFGSDKSGTFIREYVGMDLDHSHNAWMDTLICLGIPGLLLVLIFTCIAVWNIWFVFWGKHIALGQKTIAMLTVCLLVSAMMEPYLFITDNYYHHIDFIFFLCLGYLVHWRSEAQK